MLFDLVKSAACGRVDSKANTRGMAEKTIPEKVVEREAAALKAAFEKRTELSQEKFGLEFEVGSQGMVWQYLNAHRPLNLSVALKFARGLDIPVASFSPRLATELITAGVAEPRADEGYAGEQTRHIFIPRLDAIGGLGTGRHNEQHASVIGIYPLPADLVQRKGWRLDALKVIDTEGPSMAPTINDGDPVVVNLDETKIIERKIYAIEDADQGTRIKRLESTLDGRIRVISDNPEYRDDYLTPDTGARIIGRVVYRSGEV